MAAQRCEHQGSEALLRPVLHIRAVTQEQLDNLGDQLLGKRTWNGTEGGEKETVVDGELHRYQLAVGWDSVGVHFIAY